MLNGANAAAAVASLSFICWFSLLTNARIPHVNALKCAKSEGDSSASCKNVTKKETKKRARERKRHQDIDEAQ
jgi:hypothetical protein